MSESTTATASASPATEATASSESSELESTQAAEGLEGAAAEGEAAEAQAAQSAAAKKEAARIKKLKLKVDGQELEEELPFEIDDNPEAVEYMTRQLQMSKAAQKRMGEHAQLQKEVKHFLEELRKNPKKILADPSIGIDVKQLAAQIIEEEIANAQKSPEQLEKERLENELRALQEEREQEREELRQKEFARLQEIEYERYDNLMSKALESSDLPKSPYVVKKMADYMLLGLNEGIDVSPEDVLPLVREEIQNDLREMFAVMPDEVIEKIVGKEVFSRVRKKNVAKAKSAPTPVKSAIKDTGASSKATSANSAEKKSFRDFFGV
jgi:hypothetical protein